MFKFIKSTKESIEVSIMTTEQFIKAATAHDETYKDHSDFYEIAEKYGFCTPWCRCEECS